MVNNLYITPPHAHLYNGDYSHRVGLNNDSLVSVITPIYNVENYLNECIDSLLRQTYTNLEILLVNDGSTDNSLKICESYSDSRIRIITKENGGQSSARNIALDQAKGVYILFVDSDDYVENNYVERLVIAIQSDKYADVAQCSYRKSGQVNQVYTHDSVKISGIDAFEDYFNCTTLTSLVWDKIYKKSIIGDLRFELGRTMEDAIFLDLFFAYKKPNVVVIPDVLYVYRIRENSTMTRRFAKKHMLNSFHQQKINIGICEELHQHLLSKAYGRLYGDLFHYVQLYHQGRLKFSHKELKTEINKEMLTIKGHYSKASIFKLKILLSMPFLAKALFR